MNISGMNFGRAFSTQEKKDYIELRKDSSRVLGLEDTLAVTFDFNIPAEKGFNTAMGSTNSESMQGFIKFLKDMAGVTIAQFGPQGELAVSNDEYGNSQVVPSPYSGTAFALGKHTIDIKKLSTAAYANILNPFTVSAADEFYLGDKNTREYKSDYKYTLGSGKGDGILDRILHLAYSNFEKKLQSGKIDAKKLNKEFLQFKEKNKNWLEKDVLYDAFVEDYKKRTGKIISSELWEDLDKNIWTDKYDEKTKENRLSEIKKKYSDNMEYERFCQFLAFKEHKETREKLNAQDIKAFGDCLIGFADREVWANPSCFKAGWHTGGKDPNCKATNEIQTWGIPALDYSKLGTFAKDGDIVELGETGKLIYDKFAIYLSRYDGLRMDAFWQYVNPFTYNDNLEGRDEKVLDNKILKIMEKAAEDTQKSDFNPDNFILELIGFNTERGVALTKNVYPHTYSTAYAEYDENPVDLQAHRGYKDGKFFVAAASHDNDSLVKISRNPQRREKHTPQLKRDLKDGFNHLGYNVEGYRNQDYYPKTDEDFRTAKTAEIYTSKKQFFTLPDLFGMQECINISGKIDDDNWSVRIPSDYERFYYSQLSNGYGINIPKSLEVALRAKDNVNCSSRKKDELISKLSKAADILRSDGPMSEEEANLAEKKGSLSQSFYYEKDNF